MSSNIFSNCCLFLFILLLSIQSTFTLRCYECQNCTEIQSCTCTDVFETNRTDMYCILYRKTLTNGVYIEIEAFPKDGTPFHLYDTHYILVKEAIVYNDTTQIWSSLSEEITYGCPTDLCNRDDLLKQLPSNGLSLMLPSLWLNEQLQRKQQGDLALCRQCDDGKICGNSPDTINITACPRADCKGSCLATEVYENAETPQFCYDSLCTDDTSIGPTGELPSVNITAIYYINNKQFDIIEIDLVCNADYCDGLDLFKDIKDKLQKDLNNIRPFLPNHINSIYSISNLFLIMILFFQIFISY